MTCEPTLSARQARLVRELARTPGRPVHWSILADAIGVAGQRLERAKVNRTVQIVRAKFGPDIIQASGGTDASGYWLPADWNKR